MTRLPPLPRRMPHFQGALKMEAHPGQKLCVHVSAGFVMDVPGSVLCFGTFRAANAEELARIPNASPVPFIHAWAEFRGIVWSGTAQATCLPAEYYAANGATDICRLARPRLMEIAKRIGLSAHLRLHRPTRDQASVGQALLEAAGKRYRVDDYALLPLEPEA